MTFKLMTAFVLACITTHVWALERTVALPYDYSRSVSQVYVPSCTANQYVGVSASQFICKTIPTCDNGESLTSSGSGFTCEPSLTQIFKAYVVYDTIGGVVHIHRSHNATLVRLAPGLFDIQFVKPMSSDKYGIVFNSTEYGNVATTVLTTPAGPSSKARMDKTHATIYQCWAGQGCFDTSYGFIGVIDIPQN